MAKWTSWGTKTGNEATAKCRIYPRQWRLNMTVNMLWPWKLGAGVKNGETCWVTMFYQHIFAFNPISWENTWRFEAQELGGWPEWWSNQKKFVDNPYLLGVYQAVVVGALGWWMSRLQSNPMALHQHF
jgi:hypothetical protein